MPPETRSVPIGDGVFFTVPAHLTFVKKLGSGAYGTVASFTDSRTGEKLAVKKVSNAFQNLLDAKRILREIRILRHCRHENIVKLFEVFAPPCVKFDDIYIACELMESDLHVVIRKAKQGLTEDQVRHTTCQIVRSIRYLHSANVIHRDLKPANVLVNRDGEVKVCDLGLARGFGAPDDDSATITAYVVTRWYRAPEVVLDAGHYTFSIDTWAIGCILGEMLGKKALFPGHDPLDQIKKTVGVVGTPAESDIAWIPEKSGARRFLARCPRTSGRAWDEVYPDAPRGAHDLIGKLLKFNPSARITLDDALRHEWLDGLGYAESAPAAGKMDWTFDAFEPTAKRQLQNYIYAECAVFQPHILERDHKLLKDYGITEEMLRQARGDGKPASRAFEDLPPVPTNKPRLPTPTETPQRREGAQDSYCCAVS